MEPTTPHSIIISTKKQKRAAKNETGIFQLNVIQKLAGG
jgi:hypothetical protein